MAATPRVDRLLPAGTVTFLFTDIEGSTRLWETQHAAMQRALADHDAIIRAAVEDNNGFVVKTTGDGVHAAFAIAVDGVSACLAAQRALMTHGWSGPRIKSRMALHTGTSEQRDGDYYGPALNRTARLMAAAHGGQILLSLATEELVRDHLPAHTTLRDMGERRLKDLIRPERVYQVIAADLPVDFPPLKTLDSRPNNLPAQTTPLIGREHEIRAVKERMADAHVRLLTLSGVGGTGKTRLALQAAADMVDDFEHGVFFIPLAELSDPALVLPAIAQAFGVREAGGMPLSQLLHDHLRDKQLLLVLDNFEQVIAAAPAVSDLLAAAPRLKVMITSREVLRVSGERDYPVPTLSLPDPKRLPSLARLTQYEAVALFISRAVAVKPSFAVTNDNAPAVAEICCQLDGLPLAIELAAARVRVLPPQKMLPELSRRLSLVTGLARDLSARQRTLRGAIDWSHDLLTADERKLFRRLAVFVGESTLESMVAVCNQESDLPLLETVESLVGKSLVRQTEIDGEPRFAMLETIREYAGERLRDSTGDDPIWKRHRDYFLTFAEEAHPKLAGAEQAKWLQRVEDEHDNLRAGLQWSLAQPEADASLRFCGALQRFWWTRGHLTEGRKWCALALHKAEGGERTKMRAQVFNGAGALAYYQGDNAAARAQYEESLAIFRELGDPNGIGVELSNLSNVLYAQGEMPAARAALEESLAIKRELGDRMGIAISLNNLGNVVAELGDYAAARALIEESLAIDRELGDRSGIAISLNNLGDFACEQGDHATAGNLYEESLAIKRELGDRRGIAITLNGLGNVRTEQGDPAGARALYVESLTLRRELGDRRGIAHALEGLAAVAAALDNALPAVRVWGAAARLREELGAPLPPNDQPRYDRQVTAARALLGDTATFDRSWHEGRALSVEQAIAVALEESSKR